MSPGRAGRTLTWPPSGERIDLLARTDSTGAWPRGICWDFTASVMDVITRLRSGRTDRYRDLARAARDVRHPIGGHAFQPRTHFNDKILIWRGLKALPPSD